MAETPNNDIEKQLREYAQQRRDAAGTPGMHPATRAMLQAEVKQRLGGAGASRAHASRHDWLRFWPRLAFAFGAIVALGVAAILLVPPGKPAKENFALAKLEETTPASQFEVNSLPATAPALAPATRTFDDADRSVAATAAPRTLTVAGAVASPERRMDVPVAREAAKAVVPGGSMSAPTATTFGMSADTAARTEPAKAMKAGTTREAAKAIAAASAAPPTSTAPAIGQGFILADKESAAKAQDYSGMAKSSGAFATSNIQIVGYADAVGKDFKADRLLLAGTKAEDNKAQFDANASQNAARNKLGANAQFYRNVAVIEKSEGKRKQAALPVLDEFTVAQEGETLTVIDRDGSVYNGYVRLAAVETERQNLNVESSNPIQLVPNTGAGGRAGAALDQRNYNRAAQQTQNATGEAAQSWNMTQASQNQKAFAPANYYFRVEGTNRSLKQRVVFSGNLLQHTAGGMNNIGALQNSSVTLNYQQQTPRSGDAFFNSSTQNAPALNNVINGQVQLGDKKAGELNALSVGP